MQCLHGWGEREGGEREGRKGGREKRQREGGEGGTQKAGGTKRGNEGVKCTYFLLELPNLIVLLLELSIKCLLILFHLISDCI